MKKGMGGDLIGNIYLIKWHKWTCTKLSINYWNKKYSEQMFVARTADFRNVPQLQAKQKP